MFEGVFGTSMLKKAQDKKIVKINLINLREFGLGKHNKVDDTPYGGGGGMVLRPEPIYEAVEKTKKKIRGKKTQVILLTPQGKVFNQEFAEKFSKKYTDIILICGHYEGFDERIRKLADMQLSVGDYVLTGGEIPAMVIVDSVTRLLKGVRGAELGLEEESHTLKDEKGKRLLEYPHYTKPDEFRGMKVPKILLSGHHKKIQEWRTKESLRRSKKSDSI